MISCCSDWLDVGSSHYLYFSPPTFIKRLLAPQRPLPKNVLTYKLLIFRCYLLSLPHCQKLQCTIDINHSFWPISYTCFFRKTPCTLLLYPAQVHYGVHMESHIKAVLQPDASLSFIQHETTPNELLP